MEKSRGLRSKKALKSLVKRKGNIFSFNVKFNISGENILVLLYNNYKQVSK